MISPNIIEKEYHLGSAFGLEIIKSRAYRCKLDNKEALNPYNFNQYM